MDLAFEPVWSGIGARGVLGRVKERVEPSYNAPRNLSNQHRNVWKFSYMICMPSS